MRETSSRVVVGRKEGWRGAVSARASGFPRFRRECEVESRGGRSRDASRRAIRRGGRRPDPSIAPIGMSAIERLKARVREPENADGGGSHASVYAGGLRVTHPRLCPCLCRSRRRHPCRTRQPLSGPSSPPWSSPRRPSRASEDERAVAAKRRFRLVALLAECAAGARGRRRRRRRVRSRTGSLRRAGEYRGASTERGDVHERAPNAVARENDCAFGRRRHSTFSDRTRTFALSTDASPHQS